MKRIAALLAALLCLSGCSDSGNACSTDFFAMDTFMSIAVCGEGAEDSEAAHEDTKDLNPPAAPEAPDELQLDPDATRRFEDLKFGRDYEIR